MSDGNKYTVASQAGINGKGGSGSIRERLESPHRQAGRAVSSGGHTVPGVHGAGEGGDAGGADVEGGVARFSMAEVEASQLVICPTP